MVLSWTKALSSFSEVLHCCSLFSSGASILTLVSSIHHSDLLQLSHKGFLLPSSCTAPANRRTFTLSMLYLVQYTDDEQSSGTMVHSAGHDLFLFRWNVFICIVGQILSAVMNYSCFRRKGFESWPNHQVSIMNFPPCLSLTLSARCIPMYEKSTVTPCNLVEDFQRAWVKYSICLLVARLSRLTLWAWRWTQNVSPKFS
jgi:hypothetical protein